MDKKLYEEILSEIDAMTADEYWALYREAQRLPKFNPLLDLDWEPVPPSDNFDNSAIFNNASFSIHSENEARILKNNSHYESEDPLCPRAA